MPGKLPAAKLVAAAKTKLNCRTDDDLARALERVYDVKVQQTTVWAWDNDSPRSNGPTWLAAMALLHAAGWLTQEARDSLGLRPNLAASRQAADGAARISIPRLQRQARGDQAQGGSKR